MIQTIPLPLFYQSPEALHSTVHAGLRLRDGDMSFAAETPYVPIVAAEVAAASACYPIVFAGEAAHPIVVVGLERRNLFIENGRWAVNCYQPAYARRYPFAFVRLDDDRFALAIDTGSDRVTDMDEAGVPLFDDGKPTPLTERALAFCDVFQEEAAATEAFSAALAAQDLLVDRRADATLPDGRKLGLDGFRVVDADKFSALDDAVIVDWHRKGWLALIQFHLASLDRFSILLERQGNVAAPSGEILAQ